MGWCVVAGGWWGRLRWARTGPDHISPHERAFPGYAYQLVSQYSLNDYSKLAKTVATYTLTLLHSLDSPAWLVSDAPSFGWLTARLSMSPGLLSII